MALADDLKAAQGALWTRMEEAKAVSSGEADTLMEAYRALILLSMRLSQHPNDEAAIAADFAAIPLGDSSDGS